MASIKNTGVRSTAQGRRGETTKDAWFAKDVKSAKHAEDARWRGAGFERKGRVGKHCRHRHSDTYLLGSVTLTIRFTFMVTPHTQKGMPLGTVGHWKGVVMPFPFWTIEDFRWRQARGSMGAGMGSAATLISRGPWRTGEVGPGLPHPRNEPLGGQALGDQVDRCR
jgi:hypothetical protein